MEDNCGIEEKLVKDLDINDKKAVEEWDIDGKYGPKPEKDEISTPTVSVKEPDPVDTLMKSWGKSSKWEFKDKCFYLEISNLINCLVGSY